MFYELAASTWGDEELAAIQRTLASGRLTMGDEVRSFEREFAGYFGMKHAVMVNSGSSANLVGVGALFYKKHNPLKRGDEAIVPAISWGTTYHPLQQYGLKLRIVDVELDSLNIDVSRLEEALTPNTKLLVAVSILGNPAALDVLSTFADRHGLYFIEDNCESMDAELNGRKTGTFGDLNTFSFFFSHHISTMEGGMVLTDNDELADLVRCLRAHGWTRDLSPESVLFEPRDEDFFEAYRFILPGYNVRPLELSGAVGREQLRKLPKMTEARRKNHTLFQGLFGQDKRFLIQRENGKSSSFSFTIILNPDMDIDRTRVFDTLKKADIGFRIITGGCILRHDVMRHFDYSVVGDTPNAFTAHDRGFFVGNQPFDLRPQIEKLHSVLTHSC
ncbi:MAG: DegT/DnrJ/EryC1/StrS family aminotransferase [Alphaproteobacteria bacterium]|nr:DegT/DnrJ/EryC1/StrS family aminotransferase [Alphaproteobacteria bacterium]MBF0354905.1 DegT/DnrJ/EryC1/StrS family aminotransferase [Alphaproteobacteria bacterium]